MDKGSSRYRTIDEYIKSCPAAVQPKLKQLRSLIKRIAPEAKEKISYQMPTFYLNGNLVHFAVHAKHIGFYPTPSGIQHFQKDLAKYNSSKGAVQFPLDQPLPLKVIERIVKFRIKENITKK